MPRPVSRMTMDEVKAAIQALRERCDRGEITPEQFRQLREPLRARFEQLF